MRRLLISALLLLAGAPELVGQTNGDAEALEPAVAKGMRVRVAVRSARDQLTGDIAQLKGDTLYLQVEGGEAPLAIPRSDLTTLDVSRGVGNMSTLGSVMGLSAGLLAGVLAYSSNKEECARDAWQGLCELGNADDFLLIPGLALAGGVLGNVIGRAFKTESWERVPIDELKVGLLPRHELKLTVLAELRF